jgi:hypothetical protein
VGVGADEEIRIVAGGKVAQDLRDALGGQLPCSAGARSEIDQTFLSAKKQHAAFSLGLNRQEERRRKKSKRKRKMKIRKRIKSKRKRKRRKALLWPPQGQSYS